MLDHYGYLVFFLTTPLLIFLAARLLGRFLRALRHLQDSLRPDIDERDRVFALIERHMRSLCLLRLPSRFILELIACAGAMQSAVNIFATGNGALQPYGHDVFDAVPHWWGYIAAKIYLQLLFVIVYPAVLFVVLHVAFSMNAIFRVLRLCDVLDVDLLHADNCGGMARFGRLNKDIIAIYSCIGLVGVTHALTHGSLFHAAPIAVVVSTSAALQSVIGVYNVHLLLEARKRERLALLATRFRAAERAALRGGSFPVDLLAYRDRVMQVNTFPYSTTGAITELPAPLDVQSTPAVRADSDYDVCFSFAGEDREYVEAVAVHAIANGLRIFYDAYEKVALWGKDLYQHLTDVYQHRAAYCVIFISHWYAEKLWTKHELRAAQARAFTENKEYILPARFDDTELPGILQTTGYVDLRRLPPEEFAGLLVQKVSTERRGSTT